MRRSKRYGMGGLIPLVVLLGSACESSEEEPSNIGTTQAQAIWSATDRALQALEAQLLAELEAQQRSRTDGGSERTDGGLDGADGAAGGWIIGSLSAFQVEGSVDNPQGGGTATVTGMGGKQGDGWGLSLNVAIARWEVDSSTTVDGTLLLSYTLRGLRPPSMTLTVGGTLQLSKGRVTLPAEVQVRVEIEGSQRTVCGAVAGQPVGDGFCNA